MKHCAESSVSHLKTGCRSLHIPRLHHNRPVTSAPSGWNHAKLRVFVKCWFIRRGKQLFTTQVVFKGAKTSHLTHRRWLLASAPASWWSWRCRWCRGSACDAAGWSSRALVSGEARGPIHPCCRWSWTRSVSRSGRWSAEWRHSASVFGRLVAPSPASWSRGPSRWWRCRHPECGPNIPQNSCWCLCYSNNQISFIQNRWKGQKIFLTCEGVARGV